MASNLALRNSEPEKPWGRISPKRGATHEDKAIAFLKAFPIGTVLTASSFDEWTLGAGLIPSIPDDFEKRSNEWRGHVARRNKIRGDINLAGTHPRMAVRYMLASVSPAMYEVQSIQEAIGQHDILGRVESLTKTKRKQLGDLIQSADWDSLPVYERAFAEALYDDIDDFSGTIEHAARNISKKFNKLRNRLSKGVKSGEILVRNGGIKGIIEAPDDEDDL